MENNPFLDNLDDYLSGKMSSEEAAQFAASAEQDPVMKSELQTQQETISSIKNLRRLELKARLAQIPVSAGLSVFQKFGIAASTIVGASLIGLGIYYTSAPTEQVVETLPATSKPNQSVLTEESVAENSSTIILENELREAKSPISEMGEVEENNQIVVSTSVEENVPESNQPSVSDIVASDNFSAEAIGLNPAAIEDEAEFKSSSNETPSGLNTANASGKSSDMKPEIEYAKNKYHYEYDGENLSLHGEFEKTSPYSLIELNYDNKLYLHYDNTYYRIEVTNKKEKLNDYIVTDKFVINELKKYIKK